MVIADVRQLPQVADTVSSATKVVTCVTGLSLDVPLFIEKGEILKVDTKTGTYITRA